MAGKDSVSNEVLVKKNAQPEDIVFHADIMGSPFVVVKTVGRDLGKHDSGGWRIRGFLLESMARNHGGN